MSSSKHLCSYVAPDGESCSRRALGEDATDARCFEHGRVLARSRSARAQAADERAQARDKRRRARIAKRLRALEALREANERDGLKTCQGTRLDGLRCGQRLALDELRDYCRKHDPDIIEARKRDAELTAHARAAELKAFAAVELADAHKLVEQLLASLGELRGECRRMGKQIHAMAFRRRELLAQLDELERRARAARPDTREALEPAHPVTQNGADAEIDNPL